MTTAFHARPYGRFIEIRRILGERNLIEQVKAPIFLKAVLAIEIIQEPQSNLEEKDSPSTFRADFPLEQNHPFSHQ